MDGIVGVALTVDLREMKMLNVLADPPVVLGMRATKAAVQPLLHREDVRAFVFPINRGERAEMFSQAFERFQMTFDPNLIEEVWNIPSRLKRMEECRAIIVLGSDNSVVYQTKRPYGQR